MVAAHQAAPEGERATARERTAGCFLPPVPGRSPSPATPPVNGRGQMLLSSV